MPKFTHLELELVGAFRGDNKGEYCEAIHTAYRPEEYTSVFFGVYGRTEDGYAYSLKDYPSTVKAQEARLLALRFASEQGLPLLDRSYHASEEI